MSTEATVAQLQEQLEKVSADRNHWRNRYDSVRFGGTPPDDEVAELRAENTRLKDALAQAKAWLDYVVG